MNLAQSAIIVADGGVDLPDGFAEAYGIETIPLMVMMDGLALHSGVDITAADFYSRLRTGGELPTTSQPSVGDYVHAYQRAERAGLPILSFHLSAGLSGSIASARLSKDMLPHLDIRQIDTGTLSGAMGLQVMVAADMARRGEPVEAIVAACAEIGRRSDTFYTCDTLEYLRRGGRIGRVAGYVGSLLGIRPIITVDHETGTYVAAGRARSFRLAGSQIVDTIAAQAGEGSEICCMILHGDCEDEARRLLEKLELRMSVRWSTIMRPNPSLGVHIGPDTIGVAYYRGVLPVAGLADVAVAL